MAVPKKRTSKSRRRQRGIKLPQVSVNSHFISDDGTYNNRQVLVKRNKPEKNDDVSEGS